MISSRALNIHVFFRQDPRERSRLMIRDNDVRGHLGPTRGHPNQTNRKLLKRLGTSFVLARHFSYFGASVYKLSSSAAVYTIANSFKPWLKASFAGNSDCHSIHYSLLVLMWMLLWSLRLEQCFQAYSWCYRCHLEDFIVLTKRIGMCFIAISCVIG